MKTSKQTTTCRPTWLRVFAVAGAFSFVLAACAGSDGEPNAVADQRTAATTIAPTDVAGGDAAAPDSEELPNIGSGGLAQPTQAPLTTGRDIIFTADMTVAVDDVAAASSEASRIVESFGGFMFGQQTVGEPEPRTVLVFKVPPDHFQDALAALGDVGEIRSQTVSADDVTDRIVDLESRISTAETSVERLRTLLENADEIKTITELEAQLLERETLLEQLRGQLRTVRDQVSLAAITVRITQAAARPEIDVRPTSYLGFDDEGASCPGAAGISVVEGETITFCLEITNAGDTLLTDIDVKDAVLGKELDDFMVVFGDLGAPLEPGQSVVLATSVDLERTLRSQTRVTATPLTEAGTPIEGRTVSNTSTITLATEDPGGVPGFTEGLKRSWDVLANLFKLMILGIGIAIPFIWILGLGWFFLRRSRRRSAARGEAAAATGTAAAPQSAADAAKSDMEVVESEPHAGAGDRNLADDV